jgi:hypothetical protein
LNHGRKANLPASQALTTPLTGTWKREGVELAFVAALQHLPGTQRAVLILRDVLEFRSAEVARILDTTPTAVNSALQRARRAVRERMPKMTQQAELDAIGQDGQRELVDEFMRAWERADVAALVELLAVAARFTMPPLPALVPWSRRHRQLLRRSHVRQTMATRAAPRERAAGLLRVPGRSGRGPVPARRDQRAERQGRSDRVDCELPRPGRASPLRPADGDAPRRSPKER